MLTKIATGRELYRNSEQLKFSETALLLDFPGIFRSRYGDGKKKSCNVRENKVLK